MEDKGIYTLSVKSELDIDQITQRSIFDFGEYQTDAYLNGLENALQMLADNPSLGRTCNRLRKGYRRHEFRSHVIFYRERNHDIFVSRILHKRQDSQRLIKENEANYELAIDKQTSNV